MKKHVKSREEFVNEDLIDAAGAKSIANWFKTEDEPKFDIVVTDGESVITFRTRSRTEAAQLEQICMANGFKYDKSRV